MKYTLLIDNGVDLSGVDARRRVEREIPDDEIVADDVDLSNPEAVYDYLLDRAREEYLDYVTFDVEVG